MSTLKHLTEIQSAMRGWVTSRLGKRAMSRRERARRFMEESVELVQSVGLPMAEVERIIKYVYSKPKGNVGQEVGGVYTTLVTLAESCSKDTHICALMECHRIHSLPPEKFRKRQRQNIDNGIGR